MADRTEGKSWDYFLPTAYGWLDKLVTTTETQPVVGACHVVAVKKGQDEKIELSAPAMAGDLKERILKQCELMGWKGKSTTHRLVVDNKCFLLCVLTNLEVSPPQKARQLGMDAVGDLKDLDFEHGVIVA